MFPYTAEEADWLSVHAGRLYWLLSQGERERPAPDAPAVGDAPSRDRREVGPVA